MSGPATARLLLVRHCETTAQGPDAPLTRTGQDQALALARFLEQFPVDAVVSSPYRRARDSIAPFAVRARIPVEPDDRLVERRLSAEPLADWREQLQRSWQDFDHRPPGGETSREAQQRARGAVDEIAARGHRCPVLVSHGNWIALLLNSFDPRWGFAAWQGLGNPDVYQLALVPGAGPGSVERIWRD